MSYVCSLCKTTGSKIGSVVPFHYSYIEEDRDNFDWLCDKCIAEYKRQYYIRLILVDIETIIFPYKVTEAITSIFKDAVLLYTTREIINSEDPVELKIFNKVFSFLDSLQGSFIYCKYGQTTTGRYGISTIGFISNKPTIVSLNS